MGRAYLYEGQYAEARAALNKATSLAPEDDKVLNNLGNALLHSRQLQEASAAFEAALEINAGHLGARTNLANTYYERGTAEQDVRQAQQHFARALQEYEQVLADKPDHREALYSLGSLHRAMGRDGDAEEAWKQVLARYPDFAAGYLSMGELYGQTRRQGEAIDLYRTAAERLESPALYYALGSAFVGLGDLVAATAAYRNAQTLPPGELSYAYVLADVLLVRGERALVRGDEDVALPRWREAGSLLGQVVDRAPDYRQAAAKLRQVEARLHVY